MRIMGFIRITAVQCILILLLSSCSDRVQENPFNQYGMKIYEDTIMSSLQISQKFKETNMIGDSNGNKNNEGLVLKYGDWVYYATGNGGSMCRANLDGSVRQVLSKQSITDINIFKDKIYYIADTNEIKSCDLDGRNQQTIFKYRDGQCRKLYIRDGTLYFAKSVIVHEAVYEICKMNLDGSGIIKVLDDDVESASFIIDKDWIYYHKITKDKKSSLCKAKIDGTSQKKLCDDKAYYINARNGLLYYTDSLNNGILYTIRDDGSARKSMDSGVYSTNTGSVDEWIYFATSNALYKIKGNGSVVTEIFNFQDEVNDFEKVQILLLDEILFLKFDSMFYKGLFRMNTDGTERVKIWTCKLDEGMFNDVIQQE